MLHKLRDRAAGEKGFTLIELLVVILIIGILAAIALPAFLNQRSKAQDTEAKSAARTAQTAMETYYTDEQKYDGATGGMVGCGEGHRARSRRWCRQSRPGDHVTPDSYVITVTQAKTGSVFTITKATTGGVSRTCIKKGEKGCPDERSW